LRDPTVRAEPLEDGLSPEYWYFFLNQHVFFWLTEDRLQSMLCARPYRDKIHDVLVLDGPSLIKDFKDRIILSPINSGCTKPYPHPRGRDTLQQIDDYPYRSRKLAKKEGAVEVAVRDGVPNISDYIIEIQERDCKNVYRRD
jgi:hypothetical protein